MVIADGLALSAAHCLGDRNGMVGLILIIIYIFGVIVSIKF